MYLQSFLSDLSDSPERLNFCLTDTCLAAGILETKLGGEGKGVSTFLMHVFTSRYDISNVNRICLVAPQKLSVLPSSENGHWLGLGKNSHSATWSEEGDLGF